MFELIPLSVYSAVIALLVGLEAAVKPFPPVDAITGLDSYVERPSVELVTDPGEWNAVWQRHKGITPIGNTSNLAFPSIEKPPSVNFDKDEVLVIFGGLAAQGGYQVADAKITPKEVVVRIVPLPLPGTNTGRVSAYRANPYAFIMFPLTKLPLDIQTRSVAPDGSVTWHTVAHVGAQS